MMENRNLYYESVPTNSAFAEQAAVSENMSNLESDQCTGIQITVMASQEIIGSVWFPKTAAETIFFDGKIEKLYVEMRKGQCFACCQPPACFMVSGGQRSREVLLYDRCLYAFMEEENYYIVYAELTNVNSSVFHNYYVNVDTQIRIGRASSNDIVYPNRSI